MPNKEFAYRNGRLHCEAIDLSKVGTDYGTPAYIYSSAGIRKRFHDYVDTLSELSHRVCFAVKANSTLAVLSVLAREGAGFDIVSGGELFRVLKAGGDPAKVVFSGVGKTDSEVRFAIEQGIHGFNCESETEIEMISRLASAAGVVVSVAIRVNPDVDAVTHPYISTGLREHKFGIEIGRAKETYAQAAKLPGIRLNGVSCHIGSQLLTVEPLLEAAEKILAFIESLRSLEIHIRDLDLGGGLGVPYKPDETPVPVPLFVERLRRRVEGLGLTVVLEPGRSIVAEAGVLLSQVLLVKQNGDKTFVILDAGMNDLIRPALYQAHHEIVPVVLGEKERRLTADVVGPVCESGDFFAKNRDLPTLQPGDLVAIKTVGAYGFVLASNYNSRPRPSELLVDGSRIHVARRRESYEDLVRGETPFGDTKQTHEPEPCHHSRESSQIVR